MNLIVVAVLAFSVTSCTRACSEKTMKAQILLKPATEYVQKLGDRISIVCAAHATPAPVVYWRKRVGKKTWKDIPGRANSISVLYFDSIEKDDFGLYRCVVETCCNKKKEEIDTEIKVPSEPDCNKKYGNTTLMFGVDWSYATHDQAKANCEKLGMHLALIHSAEENERLKQDAATSFNRHPNARKFDGDNWIWIAGSDKDEEGTWIDLYSGKKMTYFNWDKPKQPDNWKGEGKIYHEGGQDFLAFSRIDGFWDDSFENHPRPYACTCPKRGGGKGKGRR